MKRGFWTVVEDCVGRQPEDARAAIGVDAAVLVEFFRLDPDWRQSDLPPWWSDILVEEGFQSGDFPWRVSRAGSKLRFMPK